MSNAPSKEGRHIIIAPVNESCVEPNECLLTLTSNVSVQDLMLNHLMLATLDPGTQREWELITASRADTTTIAELVTFLESRCRALELLQTTQSLKIVPYISRSLQSTGKKVI